MDNPLGLDVQAILAKNLERFMAADPTIATLPQLKAKAKIGYGAVQRAAAGKSENGYSNLKTVEALAKAIGCRPWELLVDAPGRPRALLAKTLSA